MRADTRFRQLGALTERDVPAVRNLIQRRVVASDRGGAGVGTAAPTAGQSTRGHHTAVTVDGLQQRGLIKDLQVNLTRRVSCKRQAHAVR